MRAVAFRKRLVNKNLKGGKRSLEVRKNDIIVMYLALQFALSEMLEMEIGFIISISLAVVHLFLEGTINKPSLKYMSPLVLVLIQGTVVGYIMLLQGDVSLRYYIRDLSFIVSPIVYMIYGNILSKKYNLNTLLRSIVYAGLFISCLHITNILRNIGSSQFVLMRTQFGTSSFSTIFAMIVLIASPNCIDWKKSSKNFAFVIMIISFLLYFSRTSIIIFLASVFLIYLKQNRRIDMKKVGRFFILGVAVIILGYMILPKSQTEWLIKKFTNIFNEVSVNNTSGWTYELATTRSRGYEKYSAMENYKKYSVLNKIIGSGFGTMIHLDIALIIGGEKLDALGTMHNMYYNFLIKTGIVGVLLIIVFLLSRLRAFWSRLSYSEITSKLGMILIMMIALEGWISAGFFVLYSSLGIAFCLGYIENASLRNAND